MFVRFNRGCLKDQLVPVLAHKKHKDSYDQYLLIDHNRHDKTAVRGDYYCMSGTLGKNFQAVYLADPKYNGVLHSIKDTGYAWHKLKSDYFTVIKTAVDNEQGLSYLRVLEDV